MLLQQPHAEQLLDHGAERNPGIAEQSCREFSVKEGLGNQPDLVQTGQVLTGRVDDPLGLRNCSTKGRKVSRLPERSRIHQMSPRPGTT